MNINRNNYEEYFLLYTDNELSDQEKRTVEDFIKQNCDLEEELAIIRLSVCKADDDNILDDKRFLLKQASGFINPENYEDIFLMYHDGELKDVEKKETEMFLLKNPMLKKEFELLTKTKFQPDNSIGFPSKKLLLKGEDKRRAVYIKWWKVAAAAILLGIGTWIGIDLSQSIKIKLPGETVGITPKKSNNNPSNNSNFQTNDSLNINAEKKLTSDNLNHKPVKKNIKVKPVLKQKVADNSQLVKTQKLPSTLKNNVINPENTPGEELNIPMDEVVERTEIDEIDMLKKNEQVANSSAKIVRNDDIKIALKNETNNALRTSYDLDENENTNNYAFYNITREKFNRSKVGGFLLKVKRTIKRKISPHNAAKNNDEIAVN